MKKEVAERWKRGALTNAEGVRIEAPWALRGREWGGVSPPQPTRGSGGASRAPPAGTGVAPRPKSNLVHFVAARRTLIATICLISVSLNTAVVHCHYCFERCKST